MVGPFRRDRSKRNDSTHRGRGESQPPRRDASELCRPRVSDASHSAIGARTFIRALGREELAEIEVVIDEALGRIEPAGQEIVTCPSWTQPGTAPALQAPRSPVETALSESSRAAPAAARERAVRHRVRMARHVQAGQPFEEHERLISSHFQLHRYLVRRGAPSSRRFPVVQLPNATH